MRAFLPLAFLPLPLHAQEVDLELVLLADASGSITDGEIDFQRQGYATAITDPAVLNAIRSNLTGSIAVTYVEWAANQVTVVDWSIIDSDASAAAFAAALLDPPRLATGRNAIGDALLEGKRLIDGNRFTGLRQVIDFSGDSIGNFSGASIATARARFWRRGSPSTACRSSTAARVTIWGRSTPTRSSADPAPSWCPPSAATALPRRSGAS